MIVTKPINLLIKLMTMKLVEVVVWDDCDIRTFLFGMIVTSEHWGGFPTNWEESLVRPKLVTNRDKLLLQQSKMSTSSSQSVLMFRFFFHWISTISSFILTYI